MQFKALTISGDTAPIFSLPQPRSFPDCVGSSMLTTPWIFGQQFFMFCTGLAIFEVAGGNTKDPPQITVYTCRHTKLDCFKPDGSTLSGAMSLRVAARHRVTVKCESSSCDGFLELSAPFGLPLVARQANPCFMCPFQLALGKGLLCICLLYHLSLLATKYVYHLECSHERSRWRKLFEVRGV